MDRLSWGVLLGVVAFFAIPIALAGGPADSQATEPTTAAPETPTESVEERLARQRDSIERAIAAEVNERREEQGLRPLAYSTGAQRDIAREHSDDMLRDGYYNHTAPDGREFMPSCRPTAEVLMKEYTGLAFSSPREVASPVVDAWMASDSHREIILSPRWSSIGIGVARPAGGDSYITGNFC